MKATLTFDLPEERSEYEIHHAAMSMYCAMNDFESYLREAERKCEFEDPPDFFKVRQKYFEIFEEARNKLVDAC